MSQDAFIDIPLSQLNDETLQAVIEEFITREGTDYGHEDYSLPQKVTQVMRQLQSGQARLVFDPVSESCTILANE